ncbi:MAG TPA: S8 family peptidase [Chthoniobacterales bacterium]
MSKSSRALVDLILLGPMGDRRQLQDSPILGDVWLKFAAKPRLSLDLLITPEKQFAAGPVAKSIAEEIRILRAERANRSEPAQVAYLQGLIAARLTFHELLRVIVPMTFWWKERDAKRLLSEQPAEDRLRIIVPKLIDWAKLPENDDEDAESSVLNDFVKFEAVDRYVALAGVILWTGKNDDPPLGIVEAVARLESPEPIVAELKVLLAEITDHPVSPDKEGSIWQISLNRRASPALEKSVQAVKGDAARTVFNVKCDQITWAVLDSGIDRTHDVFRGDPKEPGQPAPSRIIKAFDFSNIRKIVSLDNLEMADDALEARARQLLEGHSGILDIGKAKEYLIALAQDAGNDRPIHWELVEQFISIDPNAPFQGSGHGTHVAGIIGARGGVANGATNVSSFVDGMCPDIRLYDFRVLSRTSKDTEFAIIAALQYIRYLNERNGFIAIHGANLSLSIPHDVRNFACGRTPVCNECERLVENGVVVVAAAGNLGYQSFETQQGSYDGYAAFSITDPGNADGVITVGATHRFWPHTYGVSFFSSRGPTGDGRLKPDIVAPGERIRSCLPNAGWGELDGTSMAAPHVSGAAAMLMARYSELIGQPRRIKHILCETATDLGRERTFQGHGMLDVLRALQKI